ncbi:hypothetical protein RIF29_24171 [Crotalaria pallida]|uniref:RRM domain-containing protein n=1 Tax=Crotalaria pallida TaxID=3830 RepID=A0AAN9ELH0_CROPI
MDRSTLRSSCQILGKVAKIVISMKRNVVLMRFAFVRFRNVEVAKSLERWLDNASLGDKKMGGKFVAVYSTSLALERMDVAFIQVRSWKKGLFRKEVKVKVNDLPYDIIVLEQP